MRGGEVLRADTEWPKTACLEPAEDRLSQLRREQKTSTGGVTKRYVTRQSGEARGMVAHTDRTLATARATCSTDCFR
jgi:hypothetical protein